MKEPRILHNRRGQKAQANYPGLPQIPSSLIPHPCPPQFSRNVGFQNCVGAGSCHFGVCRGPMMLVVLSPTSFSQPNPIFFLPSCSQLAEIVTESPAKSPSAAGLWGAGAAPGMELARWWCNRYGIEQRFFGGQQAAATSSRSTFRSLQWGFTPGCGSWSQVTSAEKFSFGWK